LRQLAAGLRRGNRLMIFPEGTRSRDGALGPFKDAYAILSRELSVPVVPVVIDGATAVLPRGGRLPKFSHRIHLSYLDPMSPREGEPAADFNARVRAAIEAELAKSGRQGVTSPSTPWFGCRGSLGR
jgi:long-chain acyl-CoA synthetase